MSMSERRDSVSSGVIVYHRDSVLSGMIVYQMVWYYTKWRDSVPSW